VAPRTCSRRGGAGADQTQSLGATILGGRGSLDLGPRLTLWLVRHHTCIEAADES
jgi:hypothetical protein